ncbi:serine/threonine-protein kinase, partial [Mycobacterium sp.]|uniref:serine/threonine-protein kinase n=1 Tax=Mycobacterium sp. TaxID=1785 RepID=UPI003C7448C1
MSSRGSRSGTRFGPYELRSLLGMGGMGEVYQAYDRSRDRMVAVKLLRTELSADPSFQERFRRESRMAARLQAPHVIPVHDFGEIDGVLYIDMRLVNGGSLKDLLRVRGALEPARAASITTQVASALDAAHADGLVHRDVKPENVLLTSDDFAYLVDFGIAHAGRDHGVTSAGSVLGSCAYMAAERFSGGPVGPQSDVYSLACVLYESLTGQPPFDCADVQQLMSAHMFAPPPRPSIMRRGIGRAFDDVIAVGMAKQPAARFRSSGELAAAATAAAWGTPAPTPMPAPVMPRPSPTPPKGTRAFSVAYPNPEDTGYSPYPVALPAWVRPRRSRVPLIILGAVAVLLLVAGVLTAISAFGNGGQRRETASAAPSITTSTVPSTKTPSLSRP